jgi:NAD-dependent deacetylase
LVIWIDENQKTQKRARSVARQLSPFVTLHRTSVMLARAGLVDYAPGHAPIYYIDPKPAISKDYFPNVNIIAQKATVGVRKLVDDLL